MSKKDDESDDSPYSINQTMTNSPYGIQAGRDVIINPYRFWGLNDAQLELLRKRMAPFARPEDRSDLITCVLSDPESAKFAVSLVNTFRAAGWNLTGSGFYQAIFAGHVEGIIVKLHSREANPSGLTEFLSTIRQAGIEPFGEVDNNIPPERFQIIVGSKPHP